MVCNPTALVDPIVVHTQGLVSVLLLRWAITEHAGECIAGECGVQLSIGAEMEACGYQTAVARNQFYCKSEGAKHESM